MSKTKVSQALIPQLPIKMWNGYIDDGQVKLGLTVLPEADFSLKLAHLQALIRAGGTATPCWLNVKTACR